MSFRKLQSIMDLRAATIDLIEGFPGALTSTELTVLKRIKACSTVRVPVWTLELDSDICSELALLAVSPGENLQKFLFATCVLLLDRHENTARGTDFEWEWEEFLPFYHMATDNVRSALMNGFEQARSFNLISQEVRPSLSDFITKPRDAVLADLIGLAKSLTAEQRKNISEADRGCEASKHFAALNEVLETDFCLYPSGETWFPAEVVELTSHSPGRLGFTGCTALVLINQITDADYDIDVDFWWATHRFSYDGLEPYQKRIIHSGFRHIYETDQDWNPYWEQIAPERLASTSFIPFESSQ
jgi:hypothetical protein